jgi:hypothetical protein
MVEKAVHIPIFANSKNGSVVESSSMVLDLSPAFAASSALRSASSTVAFSIVDWIGRLNLISPCWYQTLRRALRLAKIVG